MQFADAQRVDAVRGRPLGGATGTDGGTAGAHGTLMPPPATPKPGAEFSTAYWLAPAAM